MKKELYLYYQMYDFIAQDLIAQIEENMDNEIVLRENTPGGSVLAAYGIYTKIKEHGNVHLKVDGAAMSAGAFLPLFCKSSECLDVSRFMFHRADMYVENENEQKFLDEVNKDLKAKMKMKIDSKLFKEITGYTIDDLFNPEKRIDIYLTGTEAKKIGLVDKVNKLTPKMQSEITAFNRLYSVAASSIGDKPLETNKPKIQTSNKIKMTKEQFKAEHPEIYSEVFALGVAAEKDRVESCLVFNDIDPKAVKAAIESGKPLSQKQISELTLKSLSPEVLAKLTASAAPDVKTGTPTGEAGKELTAEEKKLADFELAARKQLGLK